jgi:hypothetical protein
MSPYEAAKEAVEAERTIPDRSYCRPHDNDTNDPAFRRCWLVPGHQCDCMAEDEARSLISLFDRLRATTSAEVAAIVDGNGKSHVIQAEYVVFALEKERQSGWPVGLEYPEGDLKIDDFATWDADVNVRIDPSPKPGKYAPPPRREWEWRPREWRPRKGRR